MRTPVVVVANTRFRVRVWAGVAGTVRGGPPVECVIMVRDMMGREIGV